MKKPRQVEVPLDRPLTFKEADELLQHAYNSSVWQITNYSRTKNQLREKLYSKGYPSQQVRMYNAVGDLIFCDLVEDTLSRLEEAEILDEERFIKEFIQSKQKAGLGLNRIRLLLLQKKVDGELLEEIFEEAKENDEDEALQKTFQRYVRGSNFLNTSDPYKQRQKLIQHLLSKGFSYDDISSVVDEHFDGDD